MPPASVACAWAKQPMDKYVRDLSRVPRSPMGYPLTHVQLLSHGLELTHIAG